MVSFTLCWGQWVVFHLTLFARQEPEERQESINLTGISGGEIAEESYDEEASRPKFGFGARHG
jgi:hypothetical protein